MGAVVSVNEDFERWYTTPTAEEWASHNVKLLHFNVGDYIHTPSVRVDFFGLAMNFAV